MKRKLATCQCGLSNDGRTRDHRGRYIQPCERTATQEDLRCDPCRDGCCTMHVFGKTTYHVGITLSLDPAPPPAGGVTAFVTSGPSELYIGPVGTDPGSMLGPGGGS